MTTMSLFGEIVGGLGLVILGLWLATEGFAVAAGTELRENLERWTKDSWKAMRTGFAASLLLPTSHASSAGALGLVNSGLVQPQAALRMMIGLGLGAAMSAWTLALVAYQPWLAGFALASVGIGAMLWWSGPQERWGSYGQLIMGFGVMFLGVHVLGSGFAGLEPGTRLDDFGFGPTVGGVVLFAAGLGAAALLRSSSAVSFAVLLAVAADGIGVSSACLLLIGAGLGSGTAAVTTMRTGTAQARRIALGNAAFLVLRAAVGGFLLLALYPVFPKLGHLVGGSVPLLATFETLSFAIAAAVSWPLVSTATGFLQVRFLGVEQDPTRPDHIDDGTLTVPKLALESMRLELGKLADVGQELVRKNLTGETLTSFRRRNLEASLAGISHALLRAVARLHRGGLPTQLAEELLAFSRAHADFEKACRLAAYLPTVDPDSANWMGPVTRARLHQIRHALLHLLEGTHPRRGDFVLRQSEDEAAAIELRITELEERLLQEVVDGLASSSEVAPVLKQLAALDFFRASALEVARSLEGLQAARYARGATAGWSNLVRLAGRVGSRSPA